MHSVEIVTLGFNFSFDTALLFSIFRYAVFLELCNDPGVAMVDLLFCCSIVSEMMVVRVMSGFQCCKSFSRHTGRAT
jgi:hypothetical protein